VLGLVVLILLQAITTVAESWLNKDWLQWSTADCYHILSTSPWAVMGANETKYTYESPGHTAVGIFTPTAQMVSSLVIRQAIVRQAEFDQHYDKMKPQEKQKFDQMAADCLNLKLDDRIIVRATGAVGATVETPYLDVSGAKIPALLGPQQNAISPCPFPSISPRMPDPGPDLVFPRAVDGKPVIQPGDKKIVIETPWGHATFEFIVEKMVYKGKPDF
jgi:hypothetical protein